VLDEPSRRGRDPAAGTTQQQARLEMAGGVVGQGRRWRGPHRKPQQAERAVDRRPALGSCHSVPGPHTGALLLGEHEAASNLARRNSLRRVRRVSLVTNLESTVRIFPGTHGLHARAWHSGFPRPPAHLAHAELWRLQPLTLFAPEDNQSSTNLAFEA